MCGTTPCVLPTCVFGASGELLCLPMSYRREGALAIAVLVLRGPAVLRIETQSLGRAGRTVCDEW